MLMRKFYELMSVQGFTKKVCLFAKYLLLEISRPLFCLILDGVCLGCFLQLYFICILILGLH